MCSGEAGRYTICNAETVALKNEDELAISRGRSTKLKEALDTRISGRPIDESGQARTIWDEESEKKLADSITSD